MVVDGLDVVARLAAHQANLDPPARPARAALLALPPPRIVAALLGDGDAAALRDAWIAAWAERLGGGDGPLPALDLARDPRPLGEILDGAAADRLVVIGRRDAPGFAREVALRWPRALVEPDADLGAPLHDDPSPVAWLAPGIVRVFEGTAAPPGARRVLVGIEGDADPAEVAAAYGGARAYARSRAGRGFVPEAGLFATARGNRVRDAWRAYWGALGHEAALREAVLGLEPDLDARVRGSARAAPPRPRARVFVVTGLDGAGKSTHALALRQAIEATGRSACVLKLYRQGAFLALADELSGRTRRGAPLACFRLSRVVKLLDSLRVYRDALHPALARFDAVVLDRYTETHVAAAASQLGWDVSAHPLLAPFPPPDLAFWLTLDPAEALRRLEGRGERLSADEHAAGLAGYARWFAALARGSDGIELDARAPLGENAQRIAAAALARLGEGRSAAAAPPVAAARESGRTTPLPVVVGAPNGGAELGAEIKALAAVLRESGGAAVPASFWLEAHAAQVVLDARTTAAPRAWIPLWPEAVRRMGRCAELVGLEELARLLDPAVDVTAWAPLADDDPVCALLAPAAGARRRFVLEHNEALAAVARERGWPALSSSRSPRSPDP
jgi:thymidylate kinase